MRKGRAGLDRGGIPGFAWEAKTSHSFNGAPQKVSYLRAFQSAVSGVPVASPKNCVNS